MYGFSVFDRLPYMTIPQFMTLISDKKQSQENLNAGLTMRVAHMAKTTGRKKFNLNEVM